MATSFDIIFSQINNFTAQGRKKLEEEKAQKDAEEKKKLEQENITKEDLKEQHKEEKKNKEEQDNKSQEDQKQNEQPSSEGTGNRSIGSGLFGSSNIRSSTGSLFGNPSTLTSSIFGQPRGDNPPSIFSGAQNTEIGRSNPSSNSFQSSGASFFRPHGQIENLFGKSGAKQSPVQEENFSLA